MMASTQKRLEELQEYFRTHNKVREQRQHSSKVHSIRFNCDGRKLASGSNDKTVVVYSVDRDRLSKEKTFYGHNGPVDQLTWHCSNPDFLATASGDKTVRIWDTRAQKSVTTINTKGN